MKIKTVHMKIRTVLLLLLISVVTFAHSGKPKYHVVIDTDGSLDDMRAISMFLSGDETRILAITCSQGALMPNSGYPKVKSLLTEFHHDGIRVGLNEYINNELPVRSKFEESILWGNTIIDKEEIEFINSSALLNKALSDYKEKVTLVALGSLKTYADWLRLNPQMRTKIDRILWCNSHNIREGFNYQISPGSFEYIDSLAIPLEIIASGSNLLFDSGYLSALDTVNSKYARQIAVVHNRVILAEPVNSNQIHFWENLTPMYLNVPIMFEIKKEGHIKYISLPQSIPTDFVYEIANKILTSSEQTNNMVFVRFPTDSLLYKPEYSKMVRSTLEKYGAIEWKAITMTNEIHGHTGIYSIIGAKMGIRVLDYFNIGVNNVYVTSYAGFEPPLSCFNDGIQISTGATIGQGLITVSDSISAIPSAMFEFNGQRILVSVKSDIAERMQKDIIHGVKTFGALTEKYWMYIEELAITYWAELDRNQIFCIKTVKNF